MLSVTDAISLIYKLSQQIYAQYQLVKANKEQCRRLSERIEVITKAIQKLEQVPDKTQYQAGLNDLCQTLTDALDLIQTLGQKRWYWAVVQAGNHQKRFEELARALHQAIEQLNLGLNAQQIINREQDKADQKADLQALSAQQAEIIRLNEAALNEMQQLRMETQQAQHLLQKQVASLTLHMQQHFKPIQTEKPLIDPSLNVPFYELRIDKALGTEGIIYQGRWLEQPVTIKMVEGTLTETQRVLLIREAKVLSRLRSPRIVALYGVCMEPARTCLVLEAGGERTLSEVMRHTALTFSQRRQIAQDIVCGLHYLHARGILHRDFNPHTVLIDGVLRAKLGGFGMAKIHTLGIQTANPIYQEVAFLAPELLRGQLPHAKTDIYSLGVVLWVLYTGGLPFANQSEQAITQAVLKGIRETLPLPDTIPQPIREVITDCWDPEPFSRPDTENLLQSLEQKLGRPASPSAEAHYQQGIEAEQAKQHEVAIECYERAVAKGHMKAKTNLASFFSEGKLMPQDLIKAFQLRLDAAKQGHDRAQFAVGLMFEYGHGTNRDLNQACFWYEKAMQKDYPGAKERYEALQAHKQQKGSGARISIS